MFMTVLRYSWRILAVLLVSFITTTLVGHAMNDLGVSIPVGIIVAVFVALATGFLIGTCFDRGDDIRRLAAENTLLREKLAVYEDTTTAKAFPSYTQDILPRQ